MKELKHIKNMVQSFLVDESTELIHDTEKLDEWKIKCEELGLTQQLELTSEDKSPIPFQSMDTISQRIYETLCPAKVDFKQYKKTTIPLEVLSLIHLSVNEKYFKGIEIWYDDKSPDPLAVGFLQTGEYGHKDYFIIARWGDVLKPIEQLKTLAIKRYAESSRLALKRKIADNNTLLQNVENNTALYFDAQADYYNVTGF